MAGYFDASDEASEICKQLLTNIKNTQSNYLSMDSFLATISDSVAATDGAAAMTAAAPLAAMRSNLFSDVATRSSFRQIHDRYSSILHAIKSSHGKAARKLTVVRAIRKCSHADATSVRNPTQTSAMVVVAAAVDRRRSNRLQVAVMVYGEKLPIPEIVAIHDQSDGKSSLLEGGGSV
ncbi:hypothetical protein OsI_22712 [Oryza sativa Indica Group]|uniref:Uncharacterized protein n=1 Tax=Oryza sativa subsp. indica TaxID=39946 RepID=A2YC80_ORYSI|nr:hypothetical protein OsI_22712 [Oryza sativa Indica Group]